MSKLPEATGEALDQLRQIILAMTSDAVGDENIYYTSGVGRHVRHVVDHFVALQSGTISGVINYNVRRRDNVMESDASVALVAMGDILKWLQTFTPNDLGLIVESEISCTTTKCEQFRSNSRRELHYLINHVIHHAAVARLLAEKQGIVVEDSIGIAPATASYLRKASSNVRQVAD